MKQARPLARGSVDAAEKQRENDNELRLQGQRATQPKGACLIEPPLSVLLSGYERCYRASSDSSTTTSSFLPPVPSQPQACLPTRNISRNQYLHLHKQPATSRSKVIPVQLGAWQHGRSKAHCFKEPRTAASSSSQPAASITSQVESRLGTPAEMHNFNKQQRPQLRQAGNLVTQHWNTTKHQQPSAGKNMRQESFQQSLAASDDCSVAESCHLTTMVLPPGVVTGEDAIKYFCCGAGRPSDLIYCNVANPCKPCYSSDCPAQSQNPDYLGAGYNPYALVAVAQQDADKEQHFIVSYNGVIHMRAGQPPELTPHAEFLRETELFNVLSQLTSFKEQSLGLAFCTWHTNYVRRKFHSRARQLESRLLIRHAGVHECLQRVHHLLDAFLSPEVATGQQYPLRWLDAGLAATLQNTRVDAALPRKLSVASEALVASPVSQRQNPTQQSVVSSKQQECMLPIMPEHDPAFAAAAKGKVSSEPMPTGSCSSLSLDSTPCESLIQAVWMRDTSTAKWRLVEQSGSARATHFECSRPLLCETNVPKISGCSPVTELGVLSKLMLMSGSCSHSLHNDDRLRCMAKNADTVDTANTHILQCLSSLTQMKGVLTISDFASRQHAAQGHVSTALAQLHIQLLECLQCLRQHSLQQLAAEQAAATEAEHALHVSGKKPPLPWNEEPKVDRKGREQQVSAMLSRVARLVDMQATSHAARVAAAATAHILAAIALPGNSQEASRLCPQQFRPILGTFAQQQQQQQLCDSPALQSRVQIIVRDTEDLLQEQQQAGLQVHVCSARFEPSGDELAAAVGSLPCSIAHMLNSFPLLCNELNIAVGHQGATSKKGNVAVRNQHAVECNTRACSVCADDGALASKEVTGDESVDKKDNSCQLGTGGQPRNARLDVLLSTSGALEIQASLVELVCQQFRKASESAQLQPLQAATPLILLCSHFDPQSYLQLHTSATQVVADVTAVAGWLSQLNNWCSRVVSAQQICVDDSCPGLVVMDTTGARAALLQMADATLGSMVTILQPAFMHHCQSLQKRIEELTSVLRKSPDTLESFTAWLSEVLGHLLPGVAATIGTRKCLTMVAAENPMVSGRSGPEQTKDRMAVLTEYESLRSLLGLMRPDSANESANWASDTASMRPGSPGHEIKEAAAAYFSTVGPKPIRTAAAALSDLQAQIIAYKDPARTAGGYAVSGARSLAPSMTAYLVQARQQLVDVLTELRMQDASKVSCPAAAALERIETLKQRHLQHLQQHQQHVQAAEFFRDRAVVIAVQAYSTQNDVVSKHLSRLTEVRSAQSIWTAQVDNLYKISAVCDNSTTELKCLKDQAKVMFEVVKQFELLKPSEDVCSWETITVEEAHLAAAVKLELAAWQARLPLGELLMDEALQRRHKLLLLQLMALATTEDADAASEMHMLARLMGDDVRDLERVDMQYVQSALRHYAFHKQDLYQSVYLRAAAAAPRTKDSCGARCFTGGPVQSADGTRAGWCSNHKSSRPAGDVSQHCSADAADVSTAALLLWLSRSRQTSAVLTRVLDIARGEGQLQAKVSVIQDQLNGLTLLLSSSRVVGCFMLINLSQLAATLQELSKQLGDVASNRCHLGVLHQLEEAQMLQHDMLAAVKACETVQSDLLSLYNLLYHPAVSDCLSTKHQLAFDKAVKLWAPAILKIRSPAAAHDVGTPSIADAADPGVQDAASEGYHLHLHHKDLATAAKEAKVAIYQAHQAAAGLLVATMRQRWHRLRLVPREALLLLLQHLPSYFRTLAARQPAQLPALLLSATFRGVTHLLPAQQQGNLQVINTKSVPGTSGLMQQSPATEALSPSIICSSTMAEEHDGVATSPRHGRSVSGYWHEPILATDAADAVATVVIGALSCGSGGIISATACRPGVEVLPLQFLQQSSAVATPCKHPEAATGGTMSCLEQQQTGVVWSINSCPIMMLKTLHARAAAVLQQQTYQAIETSGTVKVQDWTGSCCAQALLLADGVVWTRSATSALQQLAAGNSNALRALADAVVLQLETVTAALRIGKQESAVDCQQQLMPASSLGRQPVKPVGAANRVVDFKDIGHHLLKQVDGEQQLPGQDLGTAQGITDRPATPDTTKPTVECAPHRCSNSSSGTTSMEDAHSQESEVLQIRKSWAATSNYKSDSSTCCSSSEGLTQQQLRGLQLLVAAGIAHREVTAELVAANVQGPADFEWGKQLRHYWQPKTRQLQVCFGPCQVEYGWEYCPAAVSTLIQPLAGGLMSAPSLLAAAAAVIELPPVIGLDITSWGGDQTATTPAQTACQMAISNNQLYKPRERLKMTPRVVTALPAVVDVLCATLGLQSTHLQCSRNTSSTELQDWLSNVVVAAAAGGSGADADVALTSQKAGLIGSVSGLHKLAPSVLAAFSNSLRQIQQELMQVALRKQDQQPEGAPATNTLGVNARPQSDSWPGNKRVYVICEVPDRCPVSTTQSLSTAYSPRCGVLGVLQQYGRCLALQAPPLPLLLECVFRQLGFVDCSDAASLLAVLLQQAADGIECSSAVSSGLGVLQGAALQQPPANHGVVRYTALQQVQRHLVGLQQTGRPEVQPGSSAFGALPEVLQQCIIPRVSKQHQELLKRTLESGLHAAERSGRIMKVLHRSTSNKSQGHVDDLGAGTFASFPESLVQQHVTQVCQLSRQGSIAAASRSWPSNGTKVVASALAGSKTSGSSMAHSTVDCSSDAENSLCSPKMLPDAAAVVCCDLHKALQLHGVCLLVGPSGIGKTLAWNTLKHAYNSIAAAAAATSTTAPIWVHCYSQVLVDAAGGADATEAQLMSLLRSYHAAVLQVELGKRQTAADRTAAARCASADTEASTGQQYTSSATPPNILVLDVEQLDGPLMHLLNQSLLCQAHVSVTACQGGMPPLLWQLPGCCAVVLECCSIADNSLEQLDRVPVVALQPPGLLDHKQQLLWEITAAFAPMQVLPQDSRSREGMQPGCAQALSVAIATLPEVASGNSDTTASLNEKLCTTAAVGLLVETAMLWVSRNMLASLAALLQDLVEAGLAISTSTQSPCSEDDNKHLGSMGTAHDWRATLLCWQCCQDAVAVAGAMWAHCTGYQGPLSFSKSKTNSTVKHSLQNSNTTNLATEATPAEQLAVKLLVFCSSWVIAGQGQQQHMMKVKDALSAVLAGAGFSWAEPPAAVGGLFSARLDLSGGEWVSWAEDATALANKEVPRDSQSASALKDMDDTLDSELPYHVRTASGLDPNTGYSTANFPGSQNDDCWPLLYSSGNSCSGVLWRRGPLFLASPRTCALQYLLYWFLAAGRSPLVLHSPGSGAKSAVKHLLNHVWPNVAARATSISSRAVGPPWNITISALPSGLTGKQLNYLMCQELLQASPLSPGFWPPGAAGYTDPDVDSHHNATVSLGAIQQQVKGQHTASQVNSIDTRKVLSTRSTHHVTHVASSASTLESSGPRLQATNMASLGQHTVMYLEEIAPSATQESLHIGHTDAPPKYLGSTAASDTSEWFRQVLESHSAAVFRTSYDSNCQVTVSWAEAGASELCAIYKFQRPQLLAATVSWSSACYASLGRLHRHLLAFDTDCLGVLTDSRIPAGALNSATTFDSAPSTKLGPPGMDCSCLINNQEVLAALFQHYAPLFPKIQEVPKSLVLRALHDIMLDLGSTLRHLKHKGLVSKHCSFNMDKYQHCIESWLALCGAHIAHVDFGKGLGAAADVAASSTSVWVAQGPITPGSPHMVTTPGRRPSLPAVASLEHVVGIEGLSSRKIQLKTMCFIVVEVICRLLTDSAAAAQEQHALQRSILLLVIHHLAVLDQPVPDKLSNTCQPVMQQSTQCPQHANQAGSNTSAADKVTDAETANQDSSKSTKHGPTEAAEAASRQQECRSSPWLQDMLARLSGAHLKGTAGSMVRSSSSRSQEHATMPAWHELWSMSDATLLESLQAALLPRRLPSRTLQQLVSIARLGRDPVLSIEGLHVAAGRYELQQLLLQQVHAAWFNPATSQHMPDRPVTNDRGLVNSSRKRGCGVPCNSMSTEDVAWAERLLPCTDFVAATHKLMWWLQDCIEQQRLIQPVSSIAACQDGAVSLACSVWGSAASVAVVSGHSLHAIRAAATTAAASMGAYMLRLNQEGLISDEQIWDAVQHVTQSVGAERAEMMTATLASSETNCSMDSRPASNDLMDGTVDCPATVDEHMSQTLVVLLELHGQETLENNIVQLLQRWMSRYPCNLSLLQSLPYAAQATATSTQQQKQQVSQEEWCKLSRVEQQQLLTQQQLLQGTAVNSYGNAEAPAQGGGTAHVINICFMLLCTPEQAQQLVCAVPALQQQCYHLCLPTSQLPEQLIADCKTELMLRCEKDLLQHVNDAAVLAHHVQQQQHEVPAGATAEAQQSTGSATEGCESNSTTGGTSSGQQQQQATAAGASSTDVVVRKLADRLAAVLANLHSSACKSLLEHTTQSKHRNSDRSLSEPCTARVAGCHSSISWQLAGQAAPLSKPYDCLRLLPQLLAETRKPLAAKRAALSSCLDALPYMQQLLRVEMNRRQHGLSREDQLAASQQQSQQLSGSASSGMPCKGGASNLEVLQECLVQWGSRWQGKLQQVNRQLTALLPHAVLAAAQLTYLGALPASEQQRLLAEWRVLVYAAIKSEDGKPWTLDKSGGSNRLDATTQPSCCAPTATVTAVPASLADSGMQPEEQYYRPLLQLLRAGPVVHAAAPGALHLAGTLQLLQPDSPLTQQLKCVAAAVELASDSGVPLVVMDPWGVLPSLLLGDSSSAPRTFTAKHSSCWRVVPKCDEHDGMDQYSTAGFITAVQKAFVAGADVLLQLQGDGQQAVEVVGATAALHSVLRLQSSASADSDLNTCCNSTASRTCQDTADAGSVGPCTSSSSAEYKGLKTSAMQGLRDAATRRPKLVIQIASSSFSQPAELIGLCHLLDLGGMCNLAHYTQGGKRTAHNSQQGKEQSMVASQPLDCKQYLPTLMLGMLMQAADPSGIQEVSVAVSEAEQCKMQLEVDEAKFMTRLAQVTTSCATAPLLLGSLASTAQDLRQSADNLAQLEAAAQLRVVQLVDPWKEHAAAVADCIQQLLQLFTGMKYALPCSVIADAVKQCATAAVAACSTRDHSTNSKYSTRLHGNLTAMSAACQQTLSASTEGADNCQEGNGAHLELTQQLQQHLAVRLPAGLCLKWQQQCQQHLARPDSMLLCDVLKTTPAEVPVIVAGRHLSAALEVVTAAAAEAVVHSTSFTTWMASQLLANGGDLKDYLCSGALAELGCSASNMPGRQQQQQWLIIHVDEATQSAVRVTAQAVQWLQSAFKQHQQQQYNQHCKMHDSSRCQDSSNPRVLIACSTQVAAAVHAAAGGMCVLYSTQHTAALSDTGSTLGPSRDKMMTPAAKIMSCLSQISAALDEGQWPALLPASINGADNLLPVFPKQRQGVISLDEQRSSRALCILQPLLVAIVRAMCLWERMLKDKNISCQQTTHTDLLGHFDLLHLYKLLQHAAVAAEGTLRADNAAVDSSSDHTTALRSLIHKTCLPLDLEQLQKLCMWAVLGPSCCSHDTWLAAYAAVQQCMTASGLGVRWLPAAKESGVQVLGDSIADAQEALCSDLDNRLLDSDTGNKEGILDGCLLPLGMTLQKEDLWALLQYKDKAYGAWAVCPIIACAPDRRVQCSTSSSLLHT